MGVTVNTLVANKSKGNMFLERVYSVSALTEAALVYPNIEEAHGSGLSYGERGRNQDGHLVRTWRQRAVSRLNDLWK